MAGYPPSFWLLLVLRGGLPALRVPSRLPKGGLPAQPLHDQAIADGLPV
jgi:hypothetical protein